MLINFLDSVYSTRLSVQLCFPPGVVERAVRFVAYLNDDSFRPLAKEFVGMVMVSAGCVPVMPSLLPLGGSVAISSTPNNGTLPDNLEVLLQLPTGTESTTIKFTEAKVTKTQTETLTTALYDEPEAIYVARHGQLVTGVQTQLKEKIA